MKALFFSFIFLISIQSIFSQVINKNIQSKILQEYRNVKIYVPSSYKRDSIKKYPLAIILDAEDLFDVYVANSKLFAKKQEAPEQIIVGISQLETRNRDCSYNRSNSMPTTSAKDFIDFINLELLQYLDDNYRISPFKVIVGKSLTANFINYFLLSNSTNFNAFININPSYAQDMLVFLGNKIPEIKIPTYYYISSGSYDSKAKQNHILAIDNLFNASKNKFLHKKMSFFKDVNYTASIGLSIPDALAFIYKMYGPISKREYDTKISKMTPPEAISYLEKKYVEIEYFFGTNISIRQRDIVRIEPLIINKSNGDYLGEFGKMILRLYPNSPLGYYYLGRYYETGNQFKKALRYYKIGYSKMDLSDPNLDGYYENISRVMRKKRK